MDEVVVNKPKRVYKKKAVKAERKPVSVSVVLTVRVNGMSYGHHEYAMGYNNGWPQRFDFGPMGAYTVPAFEKYLANYQDVDPLTIPELRNTYVGNTHRRVLHMKYIKLAKHMLRFVKAASKFEGRLRSAKDVYGNGYYEARKQDEEILENAKPKPEPCPAEVAVKAG